MAKNDPLQQKMVTSGETTRAKNPKNITIGKLERNNPTSKIPRLTDSRKQNKIKSKQPIPQKNKTGNKKNKNGQNRYQLNPPHPNLATARKIHFSEKVVAEPKKWMPATR